MKASKQESQSSNTRSKEVKLARKGGKKSPATRRRVCYEEPHEFASVFNSDSSDKEDTWEEDVYPCSYSREKPSYPSLQWSSDGSSSDEGDEDLRESCLQRNLLDDMHHQHNEGGQVQAVPVTKSRSASSNLSIADYKANVRELLLAALKLEGADDSPPRAERKAPPRRGLLGGGRHPYPAETQNLNLRSGARTSVSSPGYNNSLRERLQKLSRVQRKKLLMKAAQASPPSPPRGGRYPPLSPISSPGERVEAVPSHDPNEKRYKARLAAALGASLPSSEDSFHARLRHHRQAHYNTTRNFVAPPPRPMNRIKLHVYDLIARDTLMMLPPFGCIVEIGKCFNDVNSALHQLGTGAYHVGIDINGVEYAYGATSTPGRTGVFSCVPMLSPGYQYRTTIDLGSRPLVRRSWVAVPKQRRDSLDSGNSDAKSSAASVHSVYREVEHHVDGRQIMKEMAKEYMGQDYDILRKNCCSFARDACVRLGIRQDEIPSWFRNLAESGAMTQDMASAAVQPITSVLSSCEEESVQQQIEPDFGFEMIAKQNAEGTRNMVVVVEAKSQRHGRKGEMSLYDLRRNASPTRSCHF